MKLDLKFSSEQIVELKRLIMEAGLYDSATGYVSIRLIDTPHAYQNIYTYISNLIDENNAKFSSVAHEASIDFVDAKTQYWFSKAPSINANVMSDPATDYIRGVTQYGLEYDGKLQGISQSEIDVGLQKTSNLIGESVVNEVLKDGGIPDFNQMISGDISAAIGNDSLAQFKQTLGGWGGSFYYWDAQLNYNVQGYSPVSVGTVIQDGGTVIVKGQVTYQNSSLGEFFYANSNAIADFVISEGIILAHSEVVGDLSSLLFNDVPKFNKFITDAMTSIASGTQAQTPKTDEAKLVIDAAAVLAARWVLNDFMPGPHSTSSPVVSVIDGPLKPNNRRTSSSVIFCDFILHTGIN